MSMLKARLREFKLSGIYNSYEERIKYAQNKALSYEEFLEMIFEDEANNRKDNGYKKRYSKAKFPYCKNIEDFDFSFQPSIDKRLLNDACTCSFVKEAKNVVFIGSPGTGNYRKFLFMERCSENTHKICLSINENLSIIFGNPYLQKPCSQLKRSVSSCQIGMSCVTTSI